MTRPKPWTIPEVAAVQLYYPKGGIEAVEPHLPGRTRSSIYQRACALKLRSPKWSKPIRQNWPQDDRIDDDIRRLHASPPKRGDVEALATRLGRPTWWLSRRARSLGLITPRFREEPWSDAEIAIIEEHAELTPERVRAKLKKAGFTRTDTAIMVKRKRLGMRVERDGRHPAREIARLLGYDDSTVARWIRMGRLKAGEYGKDRSDGRVTSWEVTDRDLREFIIQNPTALELRRIPAANQPWLIELLTGRGPTA
ncbi:MAG: hypothetical protein ACRC6L_12885 [Steroidobacteraceae bacterium]